MCVIMFGSCFVVQYLSPFSHRPHKTCLVVLGISRNIPEVAAGKNRIEDPVGSS